MAQESFDLFCPECNIQTEARVIAHGTGGFKSAALNPIDAVDAEYHHVILYIALCRRCESPFLVKQSIYEIPGECETVTSEEVLYPVASRLALEGVLEPVRRAYDQALRCYSTSSFDASALMCRRCLEALCKALGATNGPLQAKLESLFKQQVIDSRLIEWAHGIRVVGNEAAHDTEAELSKEDARDSLDFTEALLMYVFALNNRFAAFTARRKQGKQL
jgi:hypothetical protein